MGEIADMMLDGTMCAGCGEWLHDGDDGDGIPGYCAACAPDYAEDKPASVSKKIKPKGGYARWQEARQATLDAICSKIILEMGARKMSKKTRKAVCKAINELLVGVMNVDGVAVIKRFEI